VLAACGGAGYGGGGGGDGVTPPVPVAGAPTVTSIRNDTTGLPSGGAAGGETVTITGTGFAPGAMVLFGTAAATDVAVDSETTLTAATPAAQPPGIVDVTVVLAGSGLAGTITRGFTFLGPAPHAIAFDVRGSPPAGGGRLRIRGLDIDASSTVTFEGSPASVVEFTPGFIAGSGVLTVVVPPFTLPPGATDGFASVVVSNADGQSSTRAPDVSADGTPWPANFHYGPPPLVTGFGPSSGAGLDVTITGSGFSSDLAGARAGLQVQLAGPSLAILPIRICPDGADPACLAGEVSPAPTSIVATVPSGLPPGNYALGVINFDGQAGLVGEFDVP
jgi:hypothetical protein